MSSTEFEVLIVGSGLPESIVAGSLAPRHSILQLEPTALYGSAAWSTLSLSQLIAWSASPATPFVSLTSTFSPTLLGKLPQPRYAFSLQPALANAAGPLVSTLVATKAAPQLSFQLLGPFVRLPPDKHSPPILLPGSKHDLFSRSDLSLLDKRRLVRLFHHALSSPTTEPTVEAQPQSIATFLGTEPYSLSPEPVAQLAALALATRSPSHASAPHALTRLQLLLRSIGRYGSEAGPGSGFLLPQHGGPGEWVEALVRASAVVGGAVQIVGREIPVLSHDPGTKTWTVQVSDGPEDVLTFKARRLVIGASHVHLIPGLVEPIQPVAYSIHRAIVVIKKTGLRSGLGMQTETAEAEARRGSPHTLVVVEMVEGADPVQALIVGEGAECCPDDEVIIYLSTIAGVPEAQNTNTADPRLILEPALARLLTPSATQLAQIFYTQQVFRHHSLKTDHKDVALVINGWPEDVEDAGLGRVAEWACEHAQEVVEIGFGENILLDSP